MGGDAGTQQLTQMGNAELRASAEQNGWELCCHESPETAGNEDYSKQEPLSEHHYVL